MGKTHPLTAYREKQDPPLSRKGLADLLGVKRETVFRWETDARKIDDELLSIVSEKTGIPRKELRPDLFDLMTEAAE
jgi:DNA-binding transcriptional regulator YdaS (Cro superfamily)